MNVVKLVGLIIVLFVASRVGGILGSSAATSARDSETKEKPRATVTTSITRQGTDGATPADFDLNFLNGIEGLIVDTLDRKMKNHFESLGMDPAELGIRHDAKSIYNDYAERTIGVTKVRVTPVGVRLVTAWGIVGNEFVRVNCMRGSDHDIVLYSGACGELIKETFSVTPY